MNIAVMSPHTSKNGTTTIAALLSYELSARNKKVCLTHTKPKSNALVSFFHIDEAEDKTANPIEITNLLREGGIRKNDISDYCKSIKENFELFTFNSDDIEFESFCDVLEFICTSFPHDYTVFDIDAEELDSKECRTVLKYCDCIIYVFSQNSTEYKSFKENKKRYFHYIKKIPNIVVVNKYNGIIGNMDDVAHGIGMKKANKWIKVSYNPYVAWGTNQGQLVTVYEFMKKRDYRLVDVDSDIKNIVNSIMSIKQVRRDKKFGKEFGKEFERSVDGVPAKKQIS